MFIHQILTSLRISGRKIGVYTDYLNPQMRKTNGILPESGHYCSFEKGCLQ